MCTHATSLFRMRGRCVAHGVHLHPCKGPHESVQAFAECHQFLFFKVTAIVFDLSSVPLGLPLNQRLSRVPNTCILCSFPAIKSLHAVSSQSLAAGLQSKAGSAPPTIGRYDGKVDTPCGVQCNLYTSQLRYRTGYQGTPDLASCRPSTAVLAFPWPKRRL